MKKQLLGAAGILAAGLIAGSAISITSANAADTTNTPAATSTDTGTTTTPPSFDGTKPPADMFSSKPVRSDEQEVSADISAKLIAAAEAKVPGATVIRAETDGDGAAYEVHMKNADGTVTTVLFDSSFNITSTETGFGHGPQGDHGPRGDHDGDSNFQVPSTGTTSGTQNG